MSEPRKVIISAVAQLCKLDDEEQLVIGPVLVPDVFDGQDDIVTAVEIRKACHRFLAKINGETRLGLMHKTFPEGLQLVECYVVPAGNTITVGDQSWVAGTWLIVVKVLDKEIWARVQAGELTGFSVGDGPALAYPVDDVEAEKMAALEAA